MERKKSLAYTVGGLCFISLLFSCNSSTGSQIGVHETERYSINPEVNTEGLKNTQYSIDSICSLHMPDNIVDIGIDKVSVTDDRIFILDTHITNKLYLFDNNGNLKATIGERGKAKGEFIGKPNEFFVDSNNKLHVFDKVGHKIIIYDKDGTVDNVIQTSGYYPHSFGLTSNDKYLMYFSVGHKNMDNARESPSSLLLFDKDCKNYKQLMPSDADLYCSISTQTFFQDNERLSFIPPFSDSVFVFKNDSIEKVVMFDFGEKFLSKELPDVLQQEDDYSFMDGYQGVLGLYRYQETESLIYLDYIYNNQGVSWLYNKKNGQTINGANLFEGVNPYSYYTFKENQIIAYVDDKTIDYFKPLYNEQSFQENLEKSPKQMKDLIEGKIQTPALVYMTLK